MEDIGSFLAELEPFKHGVHGMPIKRITYSRTEVLIEIFTQRELDSLKADWWDDNPPELGER